MGGMFCITLLVTRLDATCASFQKTATTCYFVGAALHLSVA